MEFDYVCKLFQTLWSLRHKNRILHKYYKHLKDITTDDDKLKEVNSLKDFISRNPRIQECIMDSPFYTYKQDKIHMDFVDTFAPNVVKISFWKALKEAEPIMYPNGRPTPQQAEGGGLPTGLTGILEDPQIQSLITNDPMIGDVMNQIVSSGAIDTIDPDNIDFEGLSNNPVFPGVISKITQSLGSGKYSLKDLSNTVDTISSMMGTDGNPELNSMVKNLKTALSDIQRGRQPNLNVLLESLTKLGLSSTFE